MIPGAFVEPSETNAGCVNVDPAAWEPRVDGADTFVGQRPDAVAAEPGGAAPALDVPMGIVDVASNTGNRYIRAQSIDNGGPGCAIVQNYVFDRGSNSGARSNPERLALPFGTWRFFTSNNSTTQSTEIGSGGLTVVTEGAVGSLSPSVGTVTLDPRTVLQ